jgi:hypothetical protein
MLEFTSDEQSFVLIPPNGDSTPGGFPANFALVGASQPRKMITGAGRQPLSARCAGLCMERLPAKRAVEVASIFENLV